MHSRRSPFTVLLASHNDGPHLRRALDSIRSQAEPPAAVVLVDDGSTDDSAAIAEEYRALLPLELRRHPNRRGLAAALITGMEGIATEWVARLDADDYWLPHHLAALGAAITPDDAVMAGRALIVRGTEEAPSRGPLGPLAVDVALCWDNPLVHTATAFSTRHYRLAGGYMPGIPEDFNLWSRLARTGRARILAQVSAVHIKRAGSMSDTDKHFSIKARFGAQVAHWSRLPWALRLVTFPLLIPNWLRTRR